jgi:pyruvate-formate lyase-activating enzyme
MKRTAKKSGTRSFSDGDRPVLLLADRDGTIYDDPRYTAGAMSGGDIVSLPSSELIPLPEGSKLFYIPKGRPVGFTDSGAATVVEGASAVCAFLPPGYTRTYLPAYEEIAPDPVLPLWSYTAAAWYKGAFHAAAVRVAWMKKADPALHDDEKLKPFVREKSKAHPENRLLEHLKICALEYHCFAAKNLFFGRWEAPLPTSPACNARCVGCLSYECGESPASQKRITFVPAPEEIADLAVPHLRSAEDAIVSFGQGCEGEPLIQSRTLARAAALMRDRTDRGVINLNTNGFSPDRIKTLRKAGLDSVRISLNSAVPERYHAYYRPRGFGHRDVIESISASKEAGLFTSVNLLVFPGYTDREEEAEKLLALIRKTEIDLVQMRNLSIDPYLYLNMVPRPGGRALGVRKLIRLMKKEFPGLKIGYFNLPERDIRRQKGRTRKGAADVCR